MAEEFDVNKEYERIFSTESRKNIFSPDDEEYQALRQLIIEAKREFDFKKSLPFEGVKLLSYDDFLRNEMIHEAESKGYRIFHIRQYVGNRLSVYASGYFNAKDSRFVVLKGTFFTRTEYFERLTKHIAPFARMRFVANYQYNNDVLIQKENWVFDSASLAASYILGKKSAFKEWRDDRNKTLDAYYTKYKSASIDEIEDKSFPNYVLPTNSVSEPKDGNDIPISNSAKGLQKLVNIIDSPEEYAVHLFFIHKDADAMQFCDVSGTYDRITQKFIMKSGSILSTESVPLYNFTPQGIARRNFLSKFCTKESRGYRLRNDYTFDSPNVAASYAIGGASNGWVVWKDKNGNTLADIYRE